MVAGSESIRIPGTVVGLPEEFSRDEGVVQVVEGPADSGGVVWVQTVS